MFGVGLGCVKVCGNLASNCGKWEQFARHRDHRAQKLNFSAQIWARDTIKPLESVNLILRQRSVNEHAYSWTIRHARRVTLPQGIRNAQRIGNCQHEQVEGLTQSIETKGLIVWRRDCSPSNLMAISRPPPSAMPYPPQSPAATPNRARGTFTTS